MASNEVADVLLGSSPLSGGERCSSKSVVNLINCC